MAKDDLTPKDGVVRPAFHRPQLDGITAAGQAVINANSAYISRFITAQRDNVRLSGLDQFRTSVQSPDIDVDYHYHFGQEYITITPKVTPPVDVPVEPPTITPDVPPTFTEPPIPEEDYPTNCLMVLYGSNKVAAIPMVALDNPQQGLPAIYLGDVAQGNYPGQINTGQYTFGGTGFIQTDVDLSGTGLSKSIICTTFLVDAISLNRQCIPYMNGPANQSPNATTIFTSAASVSYSSGKLSITQANINQHQCCAIDRQGQLYYGFGWDAPNVQLIVKNTDLDQTLANNAEASYEDGISTWVMPYTVNYVEWIEMYASNDYEAHVNNYVNKLPDGETQTLHFGTRVTTYTSTAEGHIYVASTPVPSGDPLTGPHANEDNITEVQGSTCYGVSTYGATMTIDGINMSYDNVYYYTYDFSTNYYQYDTAGSSDADFSGVLYRMGFYPQSESMDVMTDQVSASAVNAYQPITQATQNFPDWGGSLITGFTGLPGNTTYLSYDDGGGVASNFSASKQIVVHTTIGPVVGPPGGYYNLSYDEVEGIVQSIIENINLPLYDINHNPLENTGPGPSGTFGFSSFYDTIYGTTDTYAVGPPGAAPGNAYPVPGETGLYYDLAPPFTVNQGGSSPSRNPPGYLAQVINNEYTASILYQGYEIDGSSSLTYPTGGEGVSGDNIQGFIEVTPFPPGSQTKCYVKIVRQTNDDPPTAEWHTPYGPLYSDDPTDAINGWMHVSNPDHTIQGIVFGTKPIVYLDGVDITTKLTTALNCQATDLAACYMDIDLGTIKLLAKVQ